MSFLLLYILKLSVGLSVVWIFYALFLRRLTFYDLNRWYLVLYPLVAVFIPFINISPVIEKHDWSSNELVRIIPVVDDYAGFQNSLPASSSLSETIGFGAMEWTLILIAIGVVAMIIRLGLLYFSFLQIRKNAKLINYEKVKVYQVDRDIIPFSFGNSIFINQHQHGEAELREIIRHEFIHVKQKHSMDIIWAEIICMMNWYNPFAWLIRKAIRQNLEFIADNQVLKTGLDKKQYQYLLLKVIGIAPISIANNFNFSSLKMRIAMMNKMRSARMHMIRFLFLIPILAVMLLAFRNGIDIRANQNYATSDQVIVDTVPAKPATRAEAVQPGVATQTADAARVAERSKTRKDVKSIRVLNNKAVVELKNGDSKSFDLNNLSERKEYEEKYEYEPSAPLAPLSPISVTSSNLVITPRVATAVTMASGSNTVALAPLETTVNAAVSGNAVQVGGIGTTAVSETPALTNVTASSTPIKVTGVQLNSTVSTGTSVAPVSTDMHVTGTYTTEIPAPVSVASASGGGNLAYSPYEPVPIGDKIMEIRKKTTKEELEKIKKDLAEKGYTFEIKEIKYDDGTISFISGSVSKGKQKTSFSSDGFSRITIYENTKKDGSKGFTLHISDGKIAV